MKKLIYLLSCSVLAIFTGYELVAQVPAFAWAKNFGGANDDLALSIAVDGSGNVYSTGFFKGTVDFDPGAATAFLTSNGGSDIYVSKFDRNGNFLWAKSMGGADLTLYDLGSSIAVDALGNVFVAGNFYNTVDFDPGPSTELITSKGDADIFIMKFSTDGQFLWVETFGDIYTDEGTTVATDPSGNVFLTGNFRGTMTYFDGIGFFSVTTLGGSDSDVFLTKISSGGTLQWLERVGNRYEDRCYALTVDLDGNAYMAGWFYGTAEFHAGDDIFVKSSSGDADVFVAKFNSAGNNQFLSTTGGTLADYPHGIAVDVNGFVYVTGRYYTGDMTTLNSNIFILKLYSYGGILWNKSIGGTGDDWGWNAAVDPEGNSYYIGQFAGPVDFDLGLGTATLTSGFNYILKLDADGNFGWVEGAALAEYSLKVDRCSNVYVSGYFGGAVDFDPGVGTTILTPNGDVDAFLLKLGSAQYLTWYRDADDDSFGDPGSTIQSCIQPAGYVVNNTDCNDNNAAVHPGVQELCDGTDNNCNGSIDEGCVLPSVSINDVTVNESAGTAQLSVSLSYASNIEVNVSFRTIDGTAVSNGSPARRDFTKTSGRLVFAPGVSTQTISVAINPDNTPEVDEYFDVELTRVTGTTIADGTGRVTISEVIPTTFAKKPIFNELQQSTNELFQVKVFPNPTRKSFTINITANQHKNRISMIVRTINGQEIERMFNLRTNQSFTFGEEYMAGIYFIEIIEGENRRILKMIKL